MSRTRNSTVIGESHSAISVVNALATGKGATIGIALKCKIRATLVGRKSIPNVPRMSGVVIKSDFKDHHNLVETCRRYTEQFMKSTIPEDKIISLTIESQIPPAVGLKSSSAISIASVRAISRVLSGELGYNSVLKISCQASKDSGASITGAYDDAAACLLGGMVLTDNSKFRIVKHARVPASLGEIVIIRVPEKETKYTSSVDTKVYSSLKKDSMKAFEYAKQGKLAQAMLLNSIIQCVALGYSFEPISSAIDEGATASGISGKGPAIAALCQTQKLAHSIEKRWREEAESRITILKTQVVQPERLVKN